MLFKSGPFSFFKESVYGYSFPGSDSSYEYKAPNRTVEKFKEKLHFMRVEMDKVRSWQL